ncbi:LPXTG cell wall anchor domain-containing protein [Paenibacillus tarimensis]
MATVVEVEPTVENEPVGGEENPSAEDEPSVEIEEDTSEEEIVLDETIPLATLPKTGESSPIPFYFAGLLLASLGVILSKRKRV